VSMLDDSECLLFLELRQKGDYTSKSIRYFADTIGIAQKGTNVVGRFPDGIPFKDI